MRRIFIIEAAIIGVVGIIVGWLIGYLLCYGWSQITIYNPLTGSDRAAVDLLFADALHRRRRHLAAVLHRSRRSSRRARRRGCIRSRSSGVRHERDRAAGGRPGAARSRARSSHTLVNGIDLAVNKGEFLAITGPSGSGKSSLLYLLGLLDAPTEGDVIICGQPTSKLSEAERADVRLTRCGFVFQFHFLLPEFTSLDNVHAADARRRQDVARRRCASAALELLASLGLSDSRQAAEPALRRPAAARRDRPRAVEPAAEIIVADEPTGALDTDLDRTGVRHPARDRRSAAAPWSSSPTIPHSPRVPTGASTSSTARIHEASSGAEPAQAPPLAPATPS